MQLDFLVPKYLWLSQQLKAIQVEDDGNDKNETEITREDNAYSDLNNKTGN